MSSDPLHEPDLMHGDCMVTVWCLRDPKAFCFLCLISSAFSLRPRPQSMNNACASQADPIRDNNYPLCVFRSSCHGSHAPLRRHLLQRRGGQAWGSCDGRLRWRRAYAFLSRVPASAVGRSPFGLRRARGQAQRRASPERPSGHVSCRRSFSTLGCGVARRSPSDPVRDSRPPRRTSSA